MLTGRLQSSTRNLTLLSLFAVMYTVLRLIPMFPMIGFAATFSLSDVFSPLYGIILGPYVGGGSIVLGTFLAMMFGRPSVFLGVDFLPALVGAVSIGFIFRRGFRLVTAVYLVLIIVFLIHPLSLLFVKFSDVFIPFNWLHFVSLAILISPLSHRAVDWVSNHSHTYLALGLSILCFIGTMMQHLTGSLIFESIFGQILGIITPEAWPSVWTTAFFVYPIERISITIISALIGSALIATLRSPESLGRDR